MSTEAMQRAARELRMVGEQLVLAPAAAAVVGRADAARISSLLNRVNGANGATTTGPRANARLRVAINAVRPYGWWQDLVCAGAILGAMAALGALIWFAKDIAGPWGIW